LVRKRLLDFGKGDVLGLDIGSFAVKIVRLRKDDAGYVVTGAGIANILPSEDSDNHRKIDTVKAIRQCLQLTGIKTELAVCGLSGPEVAVRDFEFPLLPPEEIEGAVLLEASQVCPFNSGDSAVDYQLISDGDDKTRGVLVAATNALIKSRIQLVEEASLKCVLMDIDGLALLNCFNGALNGNQKSQSGSFKSKTLEPSVPTPAETSNGVGQAVAILNVGSSYTTLAIMGDDGWPFIRDITYAGDDIIKQIATENGMSTEAVKGILSGDSAPAKTQFYDSLKKACQKLIVDVAETFRYYAAHEKSTLVDKILVCGGFALAKGFVELLNSRLSAEAVLWNPFDKIRCDAGCNPRGIIQKNILQKNGPAMAVAAGLAMRSI